VRVGQEVSSGIILERVARDYVYLTINGKSSKIKVGDAVSQAGSYGTGSAEGLALSDVSIGQGIERKGNVVRVTSTLREFVSGPSLSKILMQAAAVPQYSNGELRGFGLFEIEKDSIFEKVGFLNGDVIMSINGQALNNVGQAIKVLHSLKTENEVEVELVRNGVEEKLLFHVN
jgi:type II secretion system protein C